MSFAKFKNLDNRITRKSFLQKSSLSMLALGLGSLGDLRATIPNEHSVLQPDWEGEKIRSVTYNVFNGCIGYKGINGRELPPGESQLACKNGSRPSSDPKENHAGARVVST